MAIFTKGSSELYRTTFLKFENTESNNAAEWEDILSVSPCDEPCDDIYLEFTRNHRLLKDDELKKEVWTGEMYISKQQAIVLANYLLSICREQCQP